MTIAELADALTAQGIEVRGVLHQTTHRPGVDPDVVVLVGLELGNRLSLFQYGEGRVVLLQSVLYDEDDNGLEPIGEYGPTEVDQLVEAIRGATR
jgi:hypothetical protein